MSTPVRHSDFDPCRLRAGKTRDGDKGNKYVNICYGDQEGVFVQTPVMYVPYDIRPGYTDPVTGEVINYNMNVSFSDYGANADMSRFLEKARAVDAWALDTVYENREKWLKNTLTGNVAAATRDTVQVLQACSARDATKSNANGEPYPPTLRVKISAKKPPVIIDRQTNAPLKIQDLLPGTKLALILSLNSLYVMGKTFGVTWNVQGVRVESKRIGYAPPTFLPEEDEADA